MLVKSPYDRLNIDRENLEFKDLKKIYRALVLQNSPEKEPQKFADITDAYDLLAKKEYIDEFLKSNSLFFLEIDKDRYKKEESKSKGYSEKEVLASMFETPFCDN